MADETDNNAAPPGPRPTGEASGEGADKPGDGAPELGDPTPGEGETPGGATDEHKGDNQSEKDQLVETLMRQLARSVRRKMIRQFLVEVTKQRAVEVLNLFSDTDRDTQTVTLMGVTPTQIVLVKRWLSRVVLPEVISAYDAFRKDGTLPPPEPSAAEMTLSLAVSEGGGTGNEQEPKVTTTWTHKGDVSV